MCIQPSQTLPNIVYSENELDFSSMNQGYPK